MPLPVFNIEIVMLSRNKSGGLELFLLSIRIFMTFTEGMARRFMHRADGAHRKGVRPKLCPLEKPTHRLANCSPFIKLLSLIWWVNNIVLSFN